MTQAALHDGTALFYAGALIAAAWLFRRQGWHTASRWFGWWLIAEAAQACSRLIAGPRAPDWYAVRVWMPVEAAVLILGVFACREVTPARRKALYAAGIVLAAPLAALIAAPGPPLYATFFRLRYAVWIAIGVASVAHIVRHARKPVQLAPGTMRLWIAFAAHAACRAWAIWAALLPDQAPGWISVRSAYEVAAVACFLVGAGLPPRIAFNLRGESEADRFRHRPAFGRLSDLPGFAVSALASRSRRSMP